MTEKALALLTEKKFSQLKQLLSTMNPVDLAGILEEMPQDSLPLVYRLLPKELAAEAFAEMDTRNCPLLPLHVKSSSSFSGCAILLIFVFKIVWFSSWTKPAITIPSKAMEILLFMIIVFFKLMNHYSNFHVFCLYAESGYLLYTFFARTFDETAKKHYNTFIYA